MIIGKVHEILLHYHKVSLTTALPVTNLTLLDKTPWMTGKHFYMMAGFYCTVSSFIKLNRKVSPSFDFYLPLLVFISLFSSFHIKFSGKEHTNLTLITLLAMTFGCQTFLGLMVIECRIIPLSPPLHHIGWVIHRLACQHSLGNPPIPVYQHTDAWQTYKVVFDFVSTIMMGKRKQFLMVKSSSLSAYNLILAMVAWWMPFLESSTNLGQMRKMPREPL